MRVDLGSAEQLRAQGCVTGKVGSQPVCVFWHQDRPYAMDDRCPHLGFPLHRGSVEEGLVTCHWHHARFDLASGGTLDPFADDVRVYPVGIEDGRVVVTVEDPGDRRGHHLARLEEGLEQGLTLVTAKAVLGLLAEGADPVEIVGHGIDWGVRYRGPGWGAGLTVLVAMANVLPVLAPDDRALALVHGLAFVSRDTRGRAPFFPLSPLGVDRVDQDRLESWYRRFIDTRSSDAAERTLATAVRAGLPTEALTAIMGAAVTDHVFIDEGHTLDFTNKAFEAHEHLGDQSPPGLLLSLVPQTAAARRHEEEAAWRHPEDLAGMVAAAVAALPGRLEAGTAARAAAGVAEGLCDAGKLAWSLLDDDPRAVVAALDRSLEEGATVEEVARAVAAAAGLRLTRFHVQNDHGDWDVVHHAFTAANGLHQLLSRCPSAELARGLYHGALRVYLDRFLNVPAARLPDRRITTSVELTQLQACWDEQGQVDEAGAIADAWLRQGGDEDALFAALGHALLAEDAEFHWYQTYEATVRQFRAWPKGSEEAALIVAGAARFLAAHTPTRRELPQVVRIATRLRRGEALYEDDGPDRS